MEIQSLEELIRQNERVRHFGPLGFSVNWILKPEASLQWLQTMIATYDLGPDVPETVRAYFELSRKLHTYGYFVYEFFTEASFRAYFAVELALKVRFLQEYNSQIPLTNRTTGAIDTLTVANYDQFEQDFGKEPFRRYRHFGMESKKGWDLKGHPDFDGSLNSLMKWVVQVGALRGRHVEGTLEAIRNLRNVAAHPTGTTIVMPPDSAGAIKSAFNIINQLWGYPPHDRVTANQPPTMALFGLWKSPDGSSRMVTPATSLRDTTEDRRAGHWILLQAAEQDAHNLLYWHPDYELTLYPTLVIWEGDSWEDVVVAWEDFEAAGNLLAMPAWKDRIFVVRHGNTGYERRRSPSQFRHLDSSQHDIPGTRWEIVSTDRPTEEDYWYIEGWGILHRDGQWTSSEPPPGDVVGDFETWGEADQRLRELEITGQTSVQDYPPT